MSDAAAPDLSIEALHDPAAEDIAGLAGLIERTAAHDGHRPIGEHALAELKAGPRRLPHAAFTARANDVLAGYAHLSERETRTGWPVEVFVAPDHRGRGIGAALVRTVLDHVAAHGGGRIHMWAYRPGETQRRLASAFGMTHTRTLLRMERPLPLERDRPVPDGFRIRPFTPADADEWLAVHNVAFAEHPDGGGWRPADLEWHMAEPWFDPSGFKIAVDDAGIAAYCWMKRAGDAGEIYFLGADPRSRGTGIAEAIGAAGLAWAASDGATRGVLYVDDDNAAAIRLYERLGFTRHHADACYERSVEPA